MVTIEVIARVCHEANRGFCQAIGDPSQKPWDVAPLWLKESVLEGVVVAVGGASPEALHASWLAAKVREGWTYGPVTDADLKTHTNLVPYADLPTAQRLKDHLFRAVVDALAPALEP